MYSIRSLAGGDFLYDDGRRIEFVQSPHTSGNFARKPRFLVMHYTAGGSMNGSVSWFANPASKVSAHLTIGRDGAVKQSIAFSKVAWHAGRSAWRARDGERVSGLNRHSIGIELANAGACVPTSGGGWINPLGVRVAAENIVKARHRNGSVWFDSIGNVQEPGWEVYTQAQMRAATEIAILLVDHYKLEQVVGHDDISPDRKRDPGPLFDMETFRGAVFGRGEDADILWRVRADTPDGLAIREGPTKSAAKVRGNNLDPGTVVQFNEADGRWWYVTVLDDAGNAQLDGWVYSKYLEMV